MRRRGNACACGAPCHGRVCKACYEAQRAKATENKARRCDSCGNVLSRRTAGERCADCIITKGRPDKISQIVGVLEEEASRVAYVPATPRVSGTYVVASDLHVPYHSPKGLEHLLRVADAFKITRLVVAGDLLHFDAISKFEGPKRGPTPAQELEAAARVLRALEAQFTTSIDIIPGNHDQRLGRLVAKGMHTLEGRKPYELLASAIGRSSELADDAYTFSQLIMDHFLSSKIVTIHPMPELLLNDHWLVTHPGFSSRIPPQAERRLAHKHKKSVLAGHPHIWGVGLDDSAEHVCFSLGHMCMHDEKFYYAREKPTAWPRQSMGYALIYQTPQYPQGRLIPVLLHANYFCPLELVEMIRGFTDDRGRVEPGSRKGGGVSKV